MKFVELAKTLKERIDPVYLIEGEDAYFREHAVSAIRSACALSMPELNDARVEGETLKSDRLRAFIAELNTLPFLDGKRIVRVYGFFPTEKEWDVLSSYVQKPCPTTVLLIVNAEKKKGADLRKKSGVTLVDCGKESEETLSRWCLSVFRAKSLRIDGDAAMQLIRYCAQDAARIFSEAEKFRLLLGENGVVTAALVDEHVAKDIDYKIYELTQAASRRSSSFFDILSELFEKGFDEYAALAALLSHFRTLCSVSAFRGSDEEAAKVFNIKPFAVRKQREAARALGPSRTRAIYEGLYALSAGSRSGEYTKTGAMTAAVAKIFLG